MVIETIVEISVVENADGINPGCDLVVIGNGIRINIFDNALHDTRRGTALYSVISLKSGGVAINRNVDFARFFDVVDRDNELIR